MNEYKIQLIKVDHEGDEYILEESNISADDAIEYLLEIRQKAEQMTEEALEEEEPEPEPEPRPKTKSVGGGKFHTKPCCGSKGPRHLKNCVNNPSNNGERYQSPSEKPWYFTNILDRLKDEESEESIHAALYDRITDAQFREALEWAKSELI